MKIFEKVGLFVFLAAVVGVQPANAASDFFLKLDGIQGESQDSAYAAEIDVLAWSWNVSREFDSKTGMPAGEPEVRGVKITKYVDTATVPILIKILADPSPIPKAVLTVRRVGPSPLEYLIITMEKVTIGKLGVSEAAGDDQTTERISLNA